MGREADWHRAGLYDPSAANAVERLELLGFLADGGFSIAEMVAANERGRLFALAGDRAIRGGVPSKSLSDVADELDAGPETVVTVWRALGFEEPASSAQPIATDGDIAAIRTALTLAGLLGLDAAVALLHAYRTAMARVTDAASAAFRHVGNFSVRRSGSELVTAKSWHGASALVADIGHLLDVTHRHQLDASRRHFEAAGTEAELADSEREVRLAIGFIDLSGFTAFSQVSVAEDLSEALARFERATYDRATAHGCRIVKFIGDAAMLVSASCVSLASATDEIVGQIREPVAARAGLAFGDIVAREGDYFGSAVNLAARFIGAAVPGTVVASQAFAEKLPAPWETCLVETRTFRGFDEPVPVVQIMSNRG